MKYEVWIDASANYFFEIDATSRDEAIKIAKEMARDYVRNNSAITYDVVSADKVHAG